jgi:hypothetical protein
MGLTGWCVALSGLGKFGAVAQPRPSAWANMPCACSASRSNQVYLNGYPAKLLLDKVIEIMLKRISEGTATDHSILAWLLLNNNQEEIALQLIEKGLKIDPDNHHCRRLYAKINNC